MVRRTFLILLGAVVLLEALFLHNADAARERTQLHTQRRGRLQVVTTLSDYAVLAKAIGGERIDVQSIVHSVQDPHHIRPKPSFVHMVMKADVLIATGLDLELWLPTVVNRSGNKHVRSGEIGYVAVSQGIDLVDKPKVLSQAEGDVHVFGNPHITTSPINTKQVAWNIATGLIKNDPQGKVYYEANLKELHDELDKRLFGEELVKLLGGDTLCRMAEKGNLIEFLQENKLQRKPLIDKLDGWMGRMLPLRGIPMVVYHKNWSYFLDLFGLEEAATIESKPGIPPSARSVTSLVKMMHDDNIRIIFAANYFDEHKVKTVANRTGAEAVVVPLFVGGVPGTESYFQLVDYWINGLLEAAKKTGIVSG
ncbi:metal ABC transporter substrate-binding protein [Planctomycetota bacterium]